MDTKNHYSAHEANARIAAKKKQIERDAEVGKASMTTGLMELTQLQALEIERLQTILRDNTIVPDRYPVTVSHTTFEVDSRGGGRMYRNSYFVVANDHSMWNMTDGHDTSDWNRVPVLPQASDEANVK